jgi:hypothetical protein
LLKVETLRTQTFTVIALFIRLYSIAMPSKLLTLALAALAAQSTALVLEERNLFPIIQGWALIEDNCPADTISCGARTCCPTGSGCDTSLSGSNVCCPIDGEYFTLAIHKLTTIPANGCSADVQKLSRCADSDWVLWLTNHDPICCLPGQIAIAPTDSEDYGHCVPAGSAMTSGQLEATLVSLTLI